MEKTTAARMARASARRPGWPGSFVVWKRRVFVDAFERAPVQRLELCRGKPAAAVTHLGHRTAEAFAFDASRTMSCLALPGKVASTRLGLIEGLMTVVHVMVAVQLATDGLSRGGKDWCGGRCASQGIVPSSAGVAKAPGKALADENGKLMGVAFCALMSDDPKPFSLPCASCVAGPSCLRFRGGLRASCRSTSVRDRRATGAVYKYWKALSAWLQRPTPLSRSTCGVAEADER